MKAKTASLLVPGAPESSSAYWSELSSAAPVHLRLGFAVTTFAVHVGASLRYRRAPDQLDDEEQAALIETMLGLPLGGTLLEVGKIVGCLGRYDDEART